MFSWQRNQRPRYAGLVSAGASAPFIAPAGCPTPDETLPYATSHRIASNTA